MLWLGALIVILVFVGIIRKYETRLVLFLGGLAMAVSSGNYWMALDGFTKAMVNPGLVPIICTVMGFAYVMKLTQCDLHLVHLLTRPLSKLRLLLIPGAVLVTFMTTMALPSAAGASAAVGAVLIPALAGAGVHPVATAAAIFCGTWGGAFNPGDSHITFVANMAHVEPLMVVSSHKVASLSALVVIMITLTGVIYFRKEHTGYQSPEELQVETKHLKINPLKAFIPVVPLVLIVLGSKLVGIIPGGVTVPQAMMIGIGLSFLATLTDIQQMSRRFFDGMGDAYGHVIGIIAAAAAFTSGMQAIGLTKALVEVMKSSESIAKLAATFGPLIIAFLSGSGDAATLAFNSSITPHAEQFNLGVVQLGTQAFLSGAFGRTLSPVAGAAIILAGLAQISPIELTKRNFIPMIGAALTSMIILLG